MRFRNEGSQANCRIGGSPLILRDFSPRLDTGKGAVPGFHVRVSPAGEKTFSVLYRHFGKLRRLTIGTIAQFTLDEAKEKADEAVRKAAKGIDPAQEKVVERQAETFGELAETYMTKEGSKKRSAPEKKRIIDVYLLPTLKHARAKDVTRPQVRAILDPIAERAPVQANRVLALIRKVYNFGIGRDYVVVNPAALLEAPGGKESARTRVLDFKEIKIVWNAFEQVAATSPFTSRMIDIHKIELITAQRSGEVHAMRWDEIDLDSQWWTIPVERSKNGLPHRVFLAAPALKILKAAHKENQKRTKEQGGPSPWVFPGRRRGQHISETKGAVAEIRKASGIKKHWQPHDLRRTAVTHMTGAGVSRFVVGRVLNNAEPGVTAVYDRSSYDQEKKAALELWAKLLTKILSSLKAVRND